MVKKSIGYSATYFTVIVVYQLFIHNEVRWAENAGISFMVFLVSLFFIGRMFPMIGKRIAANKRLIMIESDLFNILESW
ncbi:hypothetical protein [Bacillus sp. P14.5]|uniref:hypothetical protein n=1 Tax=Bacillus sp. P14.5 TaxID=1983400 RepID=UPI000DE94E83|nr:hypothetical protein [Bacillus sp. P14.5]